MRMIRDLSAPKYWISSTLNDFSTFWMIGFMDPTDRPYHSIVQIDVRAGTKDCTNRIFFRYRSIKAKIT